MAKWQKNEYGKLLKNPAGKAIRAIICCCGEPPPGCYYLMGAGACITPITYLLEVASNSVCTDCVPGDGISSISSGTINRKYYVSAQITSGGLYIGHAGRFLGGSKSTLASAASDEFYNGVNDCSGTPETIETILAFAKIAHDGTGFYVQAAVNVIAYRFLSFQPTGWVIDGFSPDYTPDICGDGTGPGDPQTVDNAITACSMPGSAPQVTTPVKYGGQDGTMVVTPCPPCAFDCSGCATAVVEVSGSCGTGPGECDFDGEYAFVTFAEWAGLRFQVNTLHGGTPAGCVWWWRMAVDGTPATTYRHLFVWFDGQDWQATLSRSADPFDVSDTYAEMYTDQAPVSFGCSGDKLLGTLDLVGVQIGLDAGCDDCTATVTFDCGDCWQVGPIDVTTNAEKYFNGGADFPAGCYTLRWVQGVMTYEDGVEGYRINDPGIKGWQVIGFGVSTNAPVITEGTIYDTDTEAEDHYNTLDLSERQITFTTTGVGPIAITGSDSPPGDYAGGPTTGSMVWELCPCP
jgi:hypothetical protein